MHRNFMESRPVGLSGVICVTATETIAMAELRMGK